MSKVNSDKRYITSIERDGETRYHKWAQGGTTTNVYDLTEGDKLPKDTAELISKHQGFKVIEDVV